MVIHKLTKCLIAILLLLASVIVWAENSASDISAVVAAGKVEGDVYTNSYFGIKLSSPQAKFESPSLVNVAGRRARLLNVSYDSDDGAKNYTFGVLADSLENYPKGTPLGIYVRSVRHALERDGLRTVRTEFPVSIAGLQFIGAVLLVEEKENFGYHRGIYTTFLNGYAVSIEVQCRYEEHLQELMKTYLEIHPPGHK